MELDGFNLAKTSFKFFGDWHLIVHFSQRRQLQHSLFFFVNFLKINKMCYHCSFLPQYYR